MNPHSGKVDKGLIISIFSPFYYQYQLLDTAKCVLESSNDNGCIVLRMPESDDLRKEIITFLKADKFIQRRALGNPEVERIINDRIKPENRNRRNRLIDLVKDLLAKADFYINGQAWEDGSEDPNTLRVRALDYLVDNTFSKMGYIEHPCANPQNEIQSVLRHDDTAQRVFDVNVPENNPRAVKEVREYIALCAMQSRQIVMGEIVDRFAVRPYGWNEWETVLIITKLIMPVKFSLNLAARYWKKGALMSLLRRQATGRKSP